MNRFIMFCVVLAATISCDRVSCAQSVRSGQVAHLAVKGDLDSRKLTDEVIAWLGRRDARREALVLLEFDASRARLDEATRIALAVAKLDIETAVHFGVRAPTAPGVLMIALAADRAFIGRGGGITGDASTGLPDLCEDGYSGWRGRQEHLVESLIDHRGLATQLADVLIPPLGPLFVDAESNISREGVGEQVVWMEDASAWRVRLSREQVVALGLAEPADTAGQIFRACELRVTKRERTELSSELRASFTLAGKLRDELRTTLVRLEAETKALRTTTGPGRREQESRVQSRLHAAQEGINVLMKAIKDYPELLRFEPPWSQSVGGSLSDRTKRWSKEVDWIGKKIDDLRLSIEAVGGP